MDTQAAFAVALRKIRKTKGMTQEDFDQVSSRTYLSMLERGLKSPTLGKLDELAQTMDIHPMTLLLAAYAEQSPDKSPEAIAQQAVEELRTLLGGTER